MASVFPNRHNLTNTNFGQQMTCPPEDQAAMREAHRRLMEQAKRLQTGSTGKPGCPGGSH
jgi:hypothetical protein